ncbi:hypothetical protein GF322_04855 [Candidatus Dependentiae bacterium]|nr:hypothetical protein [Candidatus Dependentiae bacterium]
MLNRHELSRQIINLTSKIFPDLQNQNNIAKDTWSKICRDELFAQKSKDAKSSFLIPLWQGNLTDTFDIKNNVHDYSVFSVDGSQIYPDRHFSGARCFLVNLGGCFIEYKKNELNRNVDFFSIPKVFLPQDLLLNMDNIPFTSEMVDLTREELELKTLFEKSLTNKSDMCFVDGSIIFWNLEGKQDEIKKYFLSNYLFWLNKFYENKILISGYISFPKSRELVNLIRLGLCRFEIADCILCHSNFTQFPCKQVDNLLDSHVVKFFLKPNQRTTVFFSTSKITKNYPEHLKPCFCYLHVGFEIARLEFPFWMAKDKKNLDFICNIAIDQSRKGQGYPVALAEAHEQAVVKGPDRDFFYHLIQKIGIEQKRRFFISKKSLKKRGLGI